MKISHAETGFILGFLDCLGFVLIRVGLKRHEYGTSPEQKVLYQDKLETFSMDSIQLLNAPLGTVVDGPQYSYFHPAADADVRTSDKRYITVPEDVCLDIQDVDAQIETPTTWHSVDVSTADLASLSSSHSLLPS